MRKAAERMDFSWQSLQKYETGEMSLSVENLGEILDAYGVTLGELGQVVRPEPSDGRYRDLDDVGTMIVRERNVDARAEEIASNPELVEALLAAVLNQTEVLARLRDKLDEPS